MNMQSDTKLSLAIFRYAILMTAFTGFVVCLLSPVILTSNPNINADITFGDTLVPAAFVAITIALFGAVMYFAYTRMVLKDLTKKKHFING